MLKFGKLAGAVAMLGFYEFRRQLEYKCKLHGSELVIISRWEPSSKTCSNCGWKNSELTLLRRVFNCPECGHSIDRDLNAAINIERIGLSLSSLRLMDVEVPTPTDEVSRKQQSTQLCLDMGRYA